MKEQDVMELERRIQKNLKGKSYSKEIYRQLNVLAQQVEEDFYDEERFKKKASLFAKIQIGNLEYCRSKIRESLINELNYDIQRTEKLTYCQAIKIVLAIDAIAIKGEINAKGVIKGVDSSLSDKVDAAYQYYKFMKKNDNCSEEEDIIKFFKILKD